MSGRIITLFGEEFAPEEQKPAGKGKGRKKMPGEPDEPGTADEAPAQPATIDVVPLPESTVTEAPVPLQVSIAEGEPYAPPSIAGEVPATPLAETYHEPLVAPQDTTPAAPLPEPPAAPEPQMVTTPVLPPAFEAPLPTQPSFTEEQLPVQYTVTPPAPPVVEAPSVPAPPPPAPAFTPTPTPAQAPTPIPTTPQIAATDDEKKVVTRKSRRTPKEDVPEEPAATDEPSQNIPGDWEGDKTYYTIGEVAALFKVKTSHIRFWTNEFKIKVRTTRKGDRLYTPAQVKEIRVIYHLVKERGFTLAGAKARLKTQNNKDTTTADLKDSLRALRAQLQSIRDGL